MDAGIDVLVLNYNGRDLLAECLPAVVRAARASRQACRVTVVDNSSTDDSAALVAEQFPDVAFRRFPNDGLCSLNAAVEQSIGRVAILLNNDIKPAEDAFDPLIEPLLADAVDGEEPIFMTAPRCYLFDGATYEGFKTAVALRRGLVQATALFDGAAEAAAQSGPTASAGAALAVDRAKFLELGGFDRLYLPGRIEDLDFCFRGFMAGYRAHYVRAAVVFHRGAATFGREFGQAGCDRLALRNTLLFHWKNLRHPWHRLQAAIWFFVRVARDIILAPFVGRDERFAFLRAHAEARRIRRGHAHPAANHAGSPEREREFFRRHAPAELNGSAARIAAWRDAEERRDADYPLARWCLRPAARKLVQYLPNVVRPWHLTLMGLACAVAAACCLAMLPPANLCAAALVLAAWFFDRCDGALARLRKQTSAAGAWLDANVDEAVDLGLHVVVALVATQASGSPWPMWWLTAFLFGKYLLMYGMAAEESLAADSAWRNTYGDLSPRSILRRLYHLPANADVRIHLLAAAAATGLLTVELAMVACYYNLRWVARYAWLFRRLQKNSHAGAAS